MNKDIYIYKTGLHDLSFERPYGRIWNGHSAISGLKGWCPSVIKKKRKKKERKKVKREAHAPHLKEKEEGQAGSRQRKKKGRKGKKKRRKGGEEVVVLNKKITIYEDPTVGSSIRFRKRDPCTRIYVLTDCFKVKH